MFVASGQDSNLIFDSSVAIIITSKYSNTITVVTQLNNKQGKNNGRF